MRNNILFSLVTLSILFITACDKDDPSYSESDLTIESGWQLDTMNTNMDELAPGIIENIDTLSQSEKDLAIQVVEAIAADIETVADCESDDTYIFSESGELVFVAGTEDCSGDEDDSFLIHPASWELDGNTLIITEGDGERTEAEIKTLNESKLVFAFDEDASEYYDIGTSVFFTIEVTMVPAD